MGYLLAFSFGVISLLLLPALPKLSALVLLPPLIFFGWPRFRLLGALLLGLAWAMVQAQSVLDQRLPVQLEGSDLVLSGQIASLPQVESDRVRFLFQLDRGQRVEGRLRLDWYRAKTSPAGGERWQLKVRLKRPHGLLNPGGFDYEAWLFRQGIAATGYVRRDAHNRRLGGCERLTLNCLRQSLRGRILERLGSGNGSAILIALLIGDRSLMPLEMRTLLRQLGVGHLFVISGLHIAMIAGFFYLLTRLLWRGASTLLLWLAARQAASIAALAGALGYSLMAGFSVPTQRALVMAGVLFGSHILGRTQSPLRGLSLAFALVLLLDPLASMDAGFWLSFGAVSAIVLVVASHRYRRIYWPIRLPYLQLSLFLLLSPLLVATGLGISPLSAIANLILIPLFGFMLVPLAFLGLALLLLSSGDWSLPLLLLSRSIDAGFNWLLATSTQWPDVLQPASTPGLTAISWMLGVMLLFVPRGLPGRMLSPVLMVLPMLQPRIPDLSHGDFRYSMLDAGQGLASVVMTRNHLLVYDTGPGRGGRFDAGRSVLVPFLHVRGVDQVDRVVISNGDNDHAGGLSALLEQYRPGVIQSGEPGRFPVEFSVTPCLRGDDWEWDGVKFAILGPGKGDRLRGNNLSCVLSVDNGRQRLLLTADMEAAAEQWLLGQAGDLASDVVTLPHHGSRSSSTLEFVRATSPRLVLGATGYLNRWRFPDEEVVRRWQSQGARVVTTSGAGALEVSFQRSTGRITLAAYRREHPRFWRDTGAESDDQPTQWVSGGAPNTVSLAVSTEVP